jgi:hypothetical protein
MAEEEPIEIMNYTHNHFMNTLNHELENLRDNSRIHRWMENDSNSPINMSSDSDSDDCFEENITVSPLPTGYKMPPKKLTFREVRDSIYKYYETEDKYSNELDILITYLKCQKQMCIKADDICHKKLMILLGPAVLGHVSITIFSPIIIQYEWSGIFISGLNAFVFVIYLLTIYFKFIPSIQVYKQLAKQYAVLENNMNFTANKYMNIEKSSEKCEFVLNHMKEMEKKLIDLKHHDVVVYPTEIKQILPIAFHINIFAFIKRIEIYKKNLIVKFKDIKNEIIYIQWKWGNDIEKKEKCRLDFLCEIKEKIKNEILHYNNAYGSMEELINKEIKRGENLCWWVHSKKKITGIDNPVLKSYLSTIFVDD